MNYYGLVGKITATEGKGADLADILLQASRLLQANPDCIHYIVSKIASSDEICVTEIWTSREAHDASLEPEDIRSLIMSARPLIAGMETFAHTEVLGGKGLISTR